MYSYEEEKHNIFTDDGQRKFLNIRDKANQLIEQSGSVMIEKCLTGDSWFVLACFDRMVELGEIREVTGKGVAGQHRVFVK